MKLEIERESSANGRVKLKVKREMLANLLSLCFHFLQSAFLLAQCLGRLLLFVH